MARTTALSALREAAGDRVLVGTLLLAEGPGWAELCGTTGLDYVCVDQMITDTDWPQTANMFRAAAAYRTSAWIRLPAYAWGGARQGTVLQPQIMRAIAIGADVVIASIDYPDDLAAMLALRDEIGHRKSWDGASYLTPKEERRLPSIIPLIETKEAVNDLTSFIEIEGVEAVWLGLGDLSVSLGAKTNDIYDPVLREVVATAVEACRGRGVTVMTNIGYRDTPAEAARAIETLKELGVGIANIVYPTYMAFRFYSELIRMTRPDFAAQPPRTEAYRRGWTTQ